MTSASGGAIPILQKPKRVVVTATKSGTEKNATVFARYFIEGLRDPAADADKNEVITVLEAFRYAEAKTAKFYDELSAWPPNIALIEDAGKGEGVKAPSVDNGEGWSRAASRCCTRVPRWRMAKDPEKQKLLKQKEELEAADRRTEIPEGVDGRGRVSPGVAASCWSTWPRPRRRWTNEHFLCVLLPLLRLVTARSGASPRLRPSKRSPAKPCAIHGDPERHAPATRV